MDISGIGARSQLAQSSQAGKTPNQSQNTANPASGGDAVKVALAGMRSSFEGAGATATTYQAVGGKVAFKSAGVEDAQPRSLPPEQEQARQREVERAEGVSVDIAQKV